METYIVTFSFNSAEKLKEKYEAVVGKIAELGNYSKKCSYIQLTKTSFGLRTSKDADFIRNSLWTILKRFDDEGYIFVIEITMQGWSGHYPDSRSDISKWLKQHVTREEEED